MKYRARRLIEEQLALSEELLRRRSDDPLLTFEPHAKQIPFIESVLKRVQRENFFLAANRSGKSDAGAYIGATLARFGRQDQKRETMEAKDRATSGWVVSLDFPSSRDIIQPKYFDNGFMPPARAHEPFIPQREILEWRISDQILKLRNGSIIGFKSADSGRSKFQGTEKDWIHFDEEPPKGVYEESVIRIGARPLDIFGTCTLLPPEGQIGGVTWIYTDKVKPWKQGKEIPWNIFTASMYDNPHLSVEEIELVAARYPEGSAQHRIRILGELIGGISGARIYGSFDFRLNVREQPAISLRRPLCWMWDFNVEPMISLIGQREKGLFRVFKELIIEEGNIGDMCEMFKSAHPYHMAEIWVYGDATGRDRSHHTNRTSYQLIMNYMADYPVPLRLKVPESNPSVPDRINAVNRASKNERGEIEVEVDSSCIELIDDMEQVLSDGKGGIKKTFNRKDPYYRRTHTSDALGYWISMECPVRAFRPMGSTPRRLPTPSYQGARVPPLSGEGYR